MSRYSDKPFWRKLYNENLDKSRTIKGTKEERLKIYTTFIDRLYEKRIRESDEWKRNYNMLLPYKGAYRASGKNAEKQFREQVDEITLNKNSIFED